VYLVVCLLLVVARYEVASRDSIPARGWDIYFLHHVQKLTLRPKGQGHLL